MAKKKTRFDAKRKPKSQAKANPKPTKKSKSIKKPKRGPRSQVLPGMERVRNGKLDSICEAIGQERAAMNQAKTEERGLIAGALQEMVRASIQTFRHAGVELARVPGAEKLRVRLTKEDGDADESDLENGGPDDSPSDEEERADAARPEAAAGEDGE